jgi:insertion element IS1 protein InsB
MQICPLKIKECVLCVINALMEYNCKRCNCLKVVKNGKSRNGEQRYLCRQCSYSFQIVFKYDSYLVKDYQITQLTKEGCGIRSTARILGISPSTVLRRILVIARNIERPYSILKGKIYEVDELFTYLGNKDNRICIAYSLNPQTGEVTDFVVGRRNKTNLTKIISTLLLTDAKQVATDKLNIYKELIPKEIHSTKNRGINHIERRNLTLRTHLKRLNRRTICYSKSIAMLYAVVKIYFWG